MHCCMRCNRTLSKWISLGSRGPLRSLFGSHHLGSSAHQHPNISQATHVLFESLVLLSGGATAVSARALYEAAIVVALYYLWYFECCLWLNSGYIYIYMYSGTLLFRECCCVFLYVADAASTLMLVVTNWVWCTNSMGCVRWNKYKKLRNSCLQCLTIQAARFLSGPVSSYISLTMTIFKACEL